MTIRAQLREAALILAIFALAFPTFFALADWLRYGGAS